MANLNVTMSGMTFENPVIVAAGPLTKDAYTIRRCIGGGAAGVIGKTVSSTGAKVPKPNMASYKNQYLLNTELWSELTVEEWIKKEMANVRVGKEPLIWGMGYVAEDIEYIVPLLDQYVDAYEISSHYVGRSIQPMLDTLAMAKKYTKKPVFMKISPGIPDLAATAKTLEDHGADGIVAINSFGPTLTIDIETRKPFMGSKNGYGWMSGPAIKPVALRHVYELAQAVNIPVMGVGGIAHGHDVIEMIMAGAAATQVLTQALMEGTKAFGRIVNEVNQWMDDHGVKSLEEIRGSAFEKINTRLDGNYLKNPAHVTAEKCIGCVKCERSCPYEAIKVQSDKKALVASDKCAGCGLCVTVCPTHAIDILGESTY